VIVGSKSDIKRDDTEEECREFAKTHNLEYYQTSSKTGENVEETIIETAKMITPITLQKLNVHKLVETDENLD